MHYCKGHVVYFYQIYYVQVSIYPLRIYLTEAMYRKLWEYLFPGDEQDVKRQVYLVETLHSLECTIRVYRCWCLNLHFIQCVHWSLLLVPSKYFQVSSGPSLDQERGNLLYLSNVNFWTWLQEVWKVSTTVTSKRGSRRGNTPIDRSSMESSHNGSRTSLSGSGLPLAPHALQGLISDAQPRVDFLLAAQALEVLFTLYMK